MEDKENFSNDLFKYTGQSTETNDNSDMEDFEPAPPPKKKRKEFNQHRPLLKTQTVMPPKIQIKTVH